MAQTTSAPNRHKSTEVLLAKQAELIRWKQPVSKTHILPVYKPSSQIKLENYDLRHTKSFMRILQMHSVLPRMLREATEPNNVFVKDYSISVEDKVKQATD